MVSYYFNGQNESLFPGEEHMFIESQRVSTYDLTPRMSTDKLVEEFCQKIKKGNYVLSVINIACPDMVAHTGKVDKTIEAIKASDDALNSLVNLAKETNSYLLVTADHGNAEGLIDLKTGKVDTQHSTQPVPFIIFNHEDNAIKLQAGKLADIAPTILNLLKIEIPPEMNGKDLILHEEKI